jgi:hypothetical protein
LMIIYTRGWRGETKIDITDAIHKQLVIVNEASLP